MRTRRLLHGAAAALLGLLLVEALLQGAAIVGHVAATRRAPGPSSGAAILCVGDSFTFGLGSSTPAQSYPGVLQTLLQARLDPAPAVRNAGWPGQDSRDVLAGLDRELAADSPRLVFILAGLNDTWSHPAPLGLDGLARSSANGSHWRWRWRTARMLRWAQARVRGGRSLRLAEPASREQDGPGVPGELTFEHGVTRLREGDAPGAIAVFRAALAQEPELYPEIVQGLVQANTAAGRMADARAALEQLESEWRLRPSARVAEAFAVSLAAVGEAERSTAFAREALASFPEHSALWYLSGQGHYRVGNLQAAEQAYERALECAAPGDCAWRAIVLRDCAQACAARDPRRAVELLIAALRLDGDWRKGRIVLEENRRHSLPELVHEALAGGELGEDDLELVRQLVAEETPEKGKSLERVLESHLMLMIERCRAQGAQPVLLTYPFFVPVIEAIHVRIAQRTGTPLVSTRQLFEIELRERPAVVLFIPDGHCSDAGYALMGHLAAESALEFLSR